MTDSITAKKQKEGSCGNIGLYILREEKSRKNDGRRIFALANLRWLLNNYNESDDVMLINSDENLLLCQQLYKNSGKTVKSINYAKCRTCFLYQWQQYKIICYYKRIMNEIILFSAPRHEIVDRVNHLLFSEAAVRRCSSE